MWRRTNSAVGLNGFRGTNGGSRFGRPANRHIVHRVNFNTHRPPCARRRKTPSRPKIPPTRPPGRPHPETATPRPATGLVRRSPLAHQRLHERGGEARDGGHKGGAHRRGHAPGQISAARLGVSCSPPAGHPRPRPVSWGMMEGVLLRQGGCRVAGSTAARVRLTQVPLPPRPPNRPAAALTWQQSPPALQKRGRQDKQALKAKFLLHLGTLRRHALEHAGRLGGGAAGRLTFERSGCRAW